MNTDRALASVRRDLRFGAWVLRGLMLLAGVAIALRVSRVEPAAGWAGVALLLVGLVWAGLIVASLRGGRLTAEAANLLTAGRHEEAEERVAQAAGTPGLLRPIRLATLGQIAALRQSQRRWGEAQQALLALARFGQATPPLRVALAEASLEVGDLAAAHRALAGLDGQAVPPDDAARVLAAQLDYQMQVGAWDAMLTRLPAKLDALSLLPPPRQAFATACLASAAARAGRRELADLLRRRLTLLTDVDTLLDARAGFRHALVIGRPAATLTAGPLGPVNAGPGGDV